jgi:hypothetical protein
MSLRQKIHLAINCFLILVILVFFVWKFGYVKSPIIDEDFFGLIALGGFGILILNSLFNVLALKNNFFSSNLILKVIRILVSVLTFILAALIFFSLIMGVYYTFFVSNTPFKDSRVKLGLYFIGFLSLTTLIVLTEQLIFQKFRRKQIKRALDEHLNTIGETKS